MKYTKKRLQEAAKDSRSVRETCHRLGIDYVSGSVQTHIAKRLRQFEIDISHFSGQGWAKGEVPPTKLSASSILVLRDSGTRRRRSMLLRALREIGRQYVCEDCLNEGQWQGKQMRLEVHHRNENALDDRQENLAILCPNCHATYE